MLRSLRDGLRPGQRYQQVDTSICMQVLDCCQDHSPLPTRDDRAWNIGPADSHYWTALDSPPTPTDQIVGARSFLVTEPTMAARLVGAKHKIKAA